MTTPTDQPSPVSCEIDGDLARVTIDNPPVNATSQAVRSGLLAAVKKAEDNRVRAVLLTCSGRTFVAGADVREFAKPPQEPHLPDVFAAIEGSPVPWVAAIHGTALGGGLELALSCAYRVIAPGALLGLPEVNLGLIPGAGGTVRLPRLVKPEEALTMISGGRPIGAVRAVEIGLADELAGGDLNESATDFAVRIMNTTKPSPLLDRSPKMPASDEDWKKAVAAAKAKARGQNSIIEAADAVKRSLALSGAEALAEERSAFLRLKEDPQSTALRYIFFAERSVTKAARTGGEAARRLQKIGVVGGGTMGSGIAAACLLAGLSVTMVERSQDAADLGRGRVLDTLDGARDRGKLTEQAHARASEAFKASTSYDALSDADLVIEAVFEDMAVKHAVFAELDRVTRPDAILASNTSYLDVAAIAAATRDPSRVVGLHFFSPAHIMKLLEVIEHDGGSGPAIATGMALGKLLGKIAVPSGVCDGFIGNRIMSAYRREADYMIEDGALPHEVDQAMRAFGFPMGVFQMQDLAGLDIAWAMRKRRAATRPADERYVAIADHLCEARRLGRKAGKGWYDYSADKRGAVDPDVTALIEAESARNGIARKPMRADEIMARILGVMQSEGEAILREGIAAAPEAIDVVMVNGYAFPRWRGGPMHMKQTAG